MRLIIPALLLLSVAACRDYDRYSYVSSEKGLLSADDYAKYGPEQAISVAVGREFGKAASSHDADGFGKQADAAVSYSKKFSSIRKITADTLGNRLVITFADGWTSQVTPITDGKRGDDTQGLPKAN